MGECVKKIIASESAMLALGGTLAKYLDKTAVIFLKGPLGAGKTTFARGLLRAQGVTGSVKSPTYSLVETYSLPDKTIHHFDLYRLNNAEALFEWGIEDYFSDAAICLIEWPEQGEKALPIPDIIFDFQCIAESRLVLGKAMTSLGQTILQQLNDE